MSLKKWIILNLKVGFFSFGSGGRQFIYLNSLVHETKTLTFDDFNQIMSLTQILPGPNLGNLVIYLGLQIAGFSGAILGLLALCTPGILVLTFILKINHLQSPLFIQFISIIGLSLFLYITISFYKQLRNLKSYDNLMTHRQNKLRTFFRYANLILAILLSWNRFSIMSILWIGLSIGLLSELIVKYESTLKIYFLNFTQFARIHIHKI